MKEASPQLSIGLLGAPEVLGAGEPLALNQVKPRALLYYLAATNRPHTREHLATLLWSESPPLNAHHSLRSTLYQLRRALPVRRGRSRLIAEGDLLRLDLRPGECDVAQFRRLLDDSDERMWRRALSLYRGPFLQGFTLADAPLFEEWARAQEEELNQLLLRALDRLAQAAESRREWDEARRYLDRLVQLDPYDEAAQRRLIRLHLARREIGAALRQYEQLETRLEQELGLAPSSETQALLSDALARDSTHQGEPAARVTAKMPVLPLIGRDEALARLQASSREARAGRGLTVLLEGEGGIGKTRLLDELAGRLRAGAPAWLVLQGACSPFDDLLSPAPFVEAFQNASVGDLSALLAAREAAIPEARGQWLYSVLQALRSLARRRPVLLAIDDLQWANSATLNLFGFLALRLRDLPVLLVGTVQRADAIPALQRLVSLGRRRGTLSLLALAPLTERDTSTLLGSAQVHAPSLESLVAWLHERSNGNPFVLTQILAHLRSEAMLTPSGDAWQLDERRWLRWRATLALPETTHDLVTWRLANLGPGAHHVLELLAVAGQPLPLALLGDVPELAVRLQALDELIRQQLLVELDDGRVNLPHYLLRDALLRRMSHSQRRSIHRRLAAAIERSPASMADLRSIARHAVAGEDVDRARQYGLRLLEKLSGEWAGAQAADFVRQLYDLLAPSAPPLEKLTLTRTLGRLHQALGDLKEATRWHRQSLDLAEEMNDPAAIAAAHFELGEVALVVNDYPAAIQAAQAGLHARAGVTTREADLDAWGNRLLGAAEAMEGSKLEAAESHLERATAVQREQKNWAELCATLFELGNVAAQRGDLSRALDLYDEAAHTAEIGRVHYYHALAHNNFAYHSLLLGRPEAARRAAAESLRLAEGHEMVGVLLFLYSTLGEIDLYEGKWTSAAESFERGLALAEELGSIERQAGYRANLALAMRGQGDDSAAIRLLEEALTLIGRQGYSHLHTRVLLLLSEILISSRRLREAEPPLQAALANARVDRRRLWLIQGERLRASLLAAQGHRPAANTLFAATLAQAQELAIPLEIARTQAAWGASLYHFSSGRRQARARLGQARATFAACNALAELRSLDSLLVADDAPVTRV